MSGLSGNTTTVYNLDESTSASDTDVFVKATSSETKKFSFANLVAAIKAKLGGAATCDVANNVTTTESGSVLDARQGAALQKQITTNADAITELNTKITFDAWLPSDGADVLSISNNGINFWSVYPDVLPSIGIPSGYSNYGSVIVFKGPNYPIILYASVNGEFAVYATTTETWITLN